MDESDLGVPVQRPSPLPFTGVSGRKRAVFYTQLSRLLSAGIGPVRALGTLAGQRGSRRLSRAAHDMAAQVQSGATLAQAFARHPNLFPENEVRMIEASEHAGAAPDTMLRIARVLEKVRSFWVQFATGLMYPGAILLMALVAVPLLLAFFQGNPTALLWAQAKAAAIVAGAILAALIGWRSLSSLSGPRVAIHGLVLAIPIFGGLARKMALARFAEMLECLYSAGVRLPEAVTRAAMACGNAAIGRRLLRCVPLLRDGLGLTVALAQCGAMSYLGLNMIEVGETSGKLDESLSKFAQYQQEDAEVTIDRLAKILPWLVYLAVIVFMVMAVLRAMAGLVQIYDNALK